MVASMPVSGGAAALPPALYWPAAHGWRGIAHEHATGSDHSRKVTRPTDTVATPSASTQEVVRQLGAGLITSQVPGPLPTFL